MSHQELDRLEVLKLIENKRINQIQGAKQLNLSTRQLRRIQLNYRKDGAKGIISKHRGKASNNKFHDEFKLEIVTLIKENYHDFGPTFAHEKLIENHSKKLSVESTRQIMIEHGIWQAKIKKRQKVFQRRAPRSRFGELIQIDGSPHDWFEGRAPNCTLLVFILVMAFCCICIMMADSFLSTIHFVSLFKPCKYCKQDIWQYIL